MIGLVYTECILISMRFPVPLPLKGIKCYRGRIGVVANMPAIDGARSLPPGEGTGVFPTGATPGRWM